jgi:hypothetical protein
MELITFKLTGVSPLLMHNARLADPTDPVTKELKKLTKKKNKTDSDLEEIKWVEWLGGMYTDEDGKRPVVPGENVHKSLVEGARKFKEGKTVTSAVLEAEPFFTLEYEGPKDVDKLRGDRKFCHYKTVVVSRSRCMRARPIFKNWSCVVAFNVDTEIINRERVIEAMRVAGEQIGIGDYRPRYGRFIAEAA